MRTVKVHFRKYSVDGMVIALLPGLRPTGGPGQCVNFKRIYGHSECQAGLVMDNTREATATEYRLLQDYMNKNVLDEDERMEVISEGRLLDAMIMTAREGGQHA